MSICVYSFKFLVTITEYRTAYLKNSVPSGHPIRMYKYNRQKHNYG